MTHRCCRVALLLLVFTLLSPMAVRGQDASAESSAPEDQRLAQARVHVSRGETLFDAGNYESALVEFESAYELLDGHPVRYQTLYNLGLCHERLFHYTAAMSYYERYLREGGAEAQDAASVRAAMSTLDGLLGTLVLHIRFEQNQQPAGLEVWLDQHKIAEGPARFGSRADPRASTFRVPGGRHTLEVRASGYEPAMKEVQVAARERVEVELELTRVQHGLKPALFWSGVGATGALAVTTAVLGARALSLHNEMLGKPPLERTHADQDRVHTRVLATDIALATTGAFALATTLLYFLTDFHADRASSSDRARLRIVPQGQLGLALRGSFR